MRFETRSVPEDVPPREQQATEPEHPDQPAGVHHFCNFLLPFWFNTPLSRGAIIAVGIIALLAGLGFTVASVFAVYRVTAGTMAPIAPVGIIAFSAFCLAVSLNCFFPRKIWWLLPVVAGGICAAILCCGGVS
jgi:hypothetical protein